MKLTSPARAIVGGATLFVLALAGYAARNPEPAPPAKPAAASAPTPAAPSALAAQPIPARARPADVADAAVGPSGSEHARETELMEPHPLTPERLAMIPPWGTVEDVRAAHQARDFERARALLKQRKQADPNWEDWRDFYTGLELIGDCLEAPSTATRSRAEAFIADFRASPMRRRVRRACGVESKPKSE